MRCPTSHAPPCLNISFASRSCLILWLKLLLHRKFLIGCAVFFETTRVISLTTQALKLDVLGCPHGGPLLSHLGKWDQLGGVSLRVTVADSIRRHAPERVRDRKYVAAQPLCRSYTPTCSSCQPPERQWSSSSPLIMNSLSSTGELPSVSASSGIRLKVNPLPPPPPHPV